jgi:hypothetical protein
MLRFGAMLFTLLAFVSVAHADMELTLLQVSNNTTGSLEWKTNGSWTTANAYISQFQMKYQPSSNFSETIYTYCVDLNHDESYKPYSVQAAPLNGTPPANSPGPPFDVTASNEIGYLYSKYGTGNLAGKALTDTSLQLALWDLAADPNRTSGPNSLVLDVNSGYYSDAHFGVKNISVARGGYTTSEVVNQVNSYLSEAYTKATNGYSVGNTVTLLENVPNSSNPEQDVLFYTPAPSGLVLWSLGALILAGFALLRRQACRKSTLVSQA